MTVPKTKNGKKRFRGKMSLAVKEAVRIVLAELPKA